MHRHKTVCIITRKDDEVSIRYQEIQHTYCLSLLFLHTSTACISSNTNVSSVAKPVRIKDFTQWFPYLLSCEHERLAIHSRTESANVLRLRKQPSPTSLRLAFAIHRCTQQPNHTIPQSRKRGLVCGVLFNSKVSESGAQMNVL